MLVVGQNAKKIASLKKALSKAFAMKDLGPAKQILGMHIVRDRTKNMLWLSQEKYVTKVLQRFNMYNAKSVGSPLTVNNKLNSGQCPKNEKDKGRDEEGVICLGCWEPNVCYGQHEAGHCT